MNIIAEMPNWASSSLLVVGGIAGLSLVVWFSRKTTRKDIQSTRDWEKHMAKLERSRAREAKKKARPWHDAPLEGYADTVPALVQGSKAVIAATSQEPLDFSAVVAESKKRQWMTLAGWIAVSGDGTIFDRESKAAVWEDTVMHVPKSEAPAELAHVVLATVPAVKYDQVEKAMLAITARGATIVSGSPGARALAEMQDQAARLASALSGTSAGGHKSIDEGEPSRLDDRRSIRELAAASAQARAMASHD